MSDVRQPVLMSAQAIATLTSSDECTWHGTPLPGPYHLASNEDFGAMWLTHVAQQEWDCTFEDLPGIVFCAAFPGNLSRYRWVSFCKTERSLTTILDLCDHLAGSGINPAVSRWTGRV